MTRYKQQAQKRAKTLWKFYRDNGGKLTKADVKRIFNKNWNDLYLRFETHGIEAPPVWDSRQEIRRRQAEMLRNLADEKGRDWLTEDEAAGALGRQKSKIASLIVNLAPYGLPIITTQETEPERYRQEITDGYGLQVLYFYLGPGEDQITYVIR